VGTAQEAKKHAHFGFAYAGDGSDSNFAFIGGGGNDDAFKVFMDGTVALREITASLPIFSNGSKQLVSNAMTGTGSVVMSVSPTLTGAPSLSTDRAQNLACLGITNSNTETYTQGLVVLTASMPTGTGRSVGLAVGTVASAKNVAHFGFAYAGSGSNSNFAFIGGHSNDDAFKVFMDGSVSVPGALSKGSGSFRIRHPLPSMNATHELVHSFIEGPQCDLIYRGSATLVSGSAAVNLDTASNMTEGTWLLLCRDEQCFTSNETGWSSVRGSVSGNVLTIECEDATSTDTVSWMVVAERHDQHIIDTPWTDDEGHVIVEPESVAAPVLGGGYE
jgi:hypothetical protein